MDKNKEYLEKDYIKLKTIYKQLIMMTIAIKPNEHYYSLVKSCLPTLKHAISLMEKKINKED